MELATASAGPSDVLRLRGRFDAHEVAPVAAWLAERVSAGRVRLVVNLDGVGFVDSTALGCLVQGMKRCRQGGGDLVLCSLRQAVRIIFELTRLDRAFSIRDTEEDALSAGPTA